ncbi:MAG: glycoside hydrolase, partial [Eubacteriales bacterium]|nr:glycoside hydrolase [Eubacteriales bacterium]
LLTSLKLCGVFVYRQPETYEKLPKETICLNWGYMPEQDEEQIKILADVGATQYTCPGVCTWNRWIPLFKNAFYNINAMTRHALKYNAIGLLNTDWGDYAHISHPSFSVPGIIYGAALAWNNSVSDFDAVNEGVSTLYYGDKTGKFMERLIELSELEVFDWYHTVRWIEAKDSSEKEEFIKDFSVEAAEKAIEQMAKALSRLKAATINVEPEHRKILHYYEVNAEGAKIFNRIGICIKQGADKEEKYELAEQLEKWFYNYSLMWRKVSKEGTLHNLRNLVIMYADFLRDREINKN